MSSSFTHIIVGLGNIGSEYENTRHNVGFMAIDNLADKLGCKINKIKFKALIGDTKIGDNRVLLMKPTTFMNNSGQAVSEVMRFYKIPPENIIVVLDDISLPVGKLRIRTKGSDGGQKGMRSIITLCGSDNFPRIKIGVGAKPNSEWDLADWVLSKFAGNDIAELKAVFDKTVSAIELMTDGKTDRAMNLYN